MKITFKLSKDEAEGFKNWESHVRPPEIATDDFLKQIFFNGIEFLNHKLMEASQQFMQNKELQEQLKKEGVTLDTETQSVTTESEDNE